MTRYRTNEELVDVIRQRQQLHGGTQAAFAQEVLGIGPAYLSDILAGNRPISDTVADKLGFRRLVVYERQEATK